MATQQLPRGLRNCNPLNLVKSTNSWLGKITPSQDPVFEQFQSIEYGIRAAMITLRSYIRKHKVDTVAAIIHRWAPDGQKAEAAYVAFVCKQTQWQPSQRIRIENKNHVIMLMQAMAHFENGREIPYYLFERAYALAFNK